MDKRTIDLTVQAPPQFRVLPVTLGVLHIIGGISLYQRRKRLFRFPESGPRSDVAVMGFVLQPNQQTHDRDSRGAPGNLQRSFQDPQNTLDIDFGNPFRVEPGWKSGLAEERARL